MRRSNASRMDGAQSVLSWDTGVGGRRWGPENAWSSNAALPSGWRPQKDSLVDTITDVIFLPRVSLPHRIRYVLPRRGEVRRTWVCLPVLVKIRCTEISQYNLGT